jgi:hypothetical protein
MVCPNRNLRRRLRRLAVYRIGAIQHRRGKGHAFLNGSPAQAYSKGNTYSLN